MIGLVACGNERKPAPAATPASGAAARPTKTGTAAEGLADLRATADVPAGYQSRIKSPGFVGFIPDDDRPAIYVSRIAADQVQTFDDFIAHDGLAGGTIAETEQWDTGWLVAVRPKTGGAPLVLSYSAAGGGEMFLCQGERDDPIVRSFCKSVRPAR